MKTARIIPKQQKAGNTTNPVGCKKGRSGHLPSQLSITLYIMLMRVLFKRERVLVEKGNNWNITAGKTCEWMNKVMCVFIKKNLELGTTNLMLTEQVIKTCPMGGKWSESYGRSVWWFWSAMAMSVLIPWSDERAPECAYELDNVWRCLTVGKREGQLLWWLHWRRGEKRRQEGQTDSAGPEWWICF